MSASVVWANPNPKSHPWIAFLDLGVAGAIDLWLLISATSYSRSASRILLQAAPIGSPIDDVKNDIERLVGVVSCHSLHVWQLTEHELVATLHLNLEDSPVRYMELTHAVRSSFRGYGVHSVTIQPEFGFRTQT